MKNYFVTLSLNIQIFICEEGSI